MSHAAATNAPLHILWRVSPHLDLIQMSGLLSGMGALEARNAVSLSVEFVSAVADRRYALMELAVTERKTGRIRNIALDFYDRADRIVPDALRRADIYFKRQFGPETRTAAGAGQVEKIVPMGLTVAGYSPRALRHVCIAIIASLRSKEARRARGALAGLLRRAFEEARLWATSPAPESALLRASDKKHGHIVFQPRLWRTNPGSRDQFDIANEDRIATVRALRTAFPHEQAIGLLRNETATQMAPELVLVEKVTTSKYHQQLRSSLVAVNCLGLSGSVGWKFAEYLAAGNAVVSQPIEKVLLAPVVEGVHYLAYRSVDECVDLCRRLMSDDMLSARMRAVNRQYFLDWVNPPAHMAHLLKRAFS